ncbi:hypothetical protein F3Y22_tig00110610pilonHSYRG00266 [Hibiscus syriacus]|uniref:RNase H type-1 domain-containing protein n=1 Tax=Hibiscus syriacus TaxID=106335 RepID=A0A6A3A1Q0_HIBSY|nr:hypothetical protein F3Y22_tig00110610pilonHSYRG00266 [Hibiscus syriacus]
MVGRGRGRKNIIFEAVEALGPEFTEVMAIKTALLVFIEVGWVGKAPLVVELECQVALNWITPSLLRPWKWWSVFGEMDRLAKEISLRHFAYTLRLQNGMADHLAKEGASVDNG